MYHLYRFGSMLGDERSKTFDAHGERGRVQRTGEMRWWAKVNDGTRWDASVTGMRVGH